MCKLRRITHRLNIKPRALLSLWVIRQSLHIDKIYKNKMYSYNNAKTCHKFSITQIPHFFLAIRLEQN